MEQYFSQLSEKRTATEALPKVSEISYWEFLLHLIFNPEFLKY